MFVIMFNNNKHKIMILLFNFYESMGNNVCKVFYSLLKYFIKII